MWGGAIPGGEEEEDEWDRVGREMGVEGYCELARFFFFFFFFALFLFVSFFLTSFTPPFSP